MGRKRHSIMFHESTWERLTNECLDRDVSVSYLVEKAVDDYIDRLVPLDQMRTNGDN